MTTVAAAIYREGGGCRIVVAADSKASDDNGVLSFRTPKLHRIKSSVYAIAGNDWVDYFLEWRRTGNLPPRIIDLHEEEVDFAVIEAAPDGLWYWNRTFTRVKINDDFFAIGSGELVAMYAMKELGMHPSDAVHAAAKVDSHTNDDVTVEVVVLKKRSRGDYPGP